MKKLNALKKLFVLAASALMLAVLPGANTLTASAAEPVTYYIMYDENASGGNWFYQIGSAWDNTIQHTEIYYMLETLKDGDVIIVGNGAPSQLILDVHLSNLTINNAGESFVQISITGGIDECFFLNGTQGSVEGNVTNAYVYNNSLANVNSNVTNLYSHADYPDSGPTIGVAGTVAYYQATNSYETFVRRGINFKAGSFEVKDGSLNTPYDKYTPETANPVTPVPSQTSTPSQTPAPSPTPAPADEYDKVPKTGESSSLVWLSLFAASCLSISLILRRSAAR